jgi:hypothetical protein
MDSSKDMREAGMTQRKTDPKAVDVWVRRSLADHYGDTLHEPLPEEWMKLLSPERRD